MNTILVHILFKKSWLWETSSKIRLKFFRYSSSHTTASISKWFVGSSRSTRVGPMNRARANEIHILNPPLNSHVSWAATKRRGFFTMSESSRSYSERERKWFSFLADNQTVASSGIKIRRHDVNWIRLILVIQRLTRCFSATSPALITSKIFPKYSRHLIKRNLIQVEKFTPLPPAWVCIARWTLPPAQNRNAEMGHTPTQEED